MKTFSITKIFWLLVGVFIFVLCQLFFPFLNQLFSGSVLFLIPLAGFSLLGLALLVLTLKQKPEKTLRKFLLLTAISSTGFFVSVVLHNLFYALAIVVEDIVVLNYMAEGLDIAFFFIGVVACPIGFLIGMIGSAILLAKKGRKN